MLLHLGLLLHLGPVITPVPSTGPALRGDGVRGVYEGVRFHRICRFDMYSSWGHTGEQDSIALDLLAPIFNDKRDEVVRRAIGEVRGWLGSIWWEVRHFLLLYWSSQVGHGRHATNHPISTLPDLVVASWQCGQPSRLVAPTSEVTQSSM